MLRLHSARRWRSRHVRVQRRQKRAWGEICIEPRQLLSQHMGFPARAELLESGPLTGRGAVTAIE